MSDSGDVWDRAAGDVGQPRERVWDREAERQRKAEYRERKRAEAKTQEALQRLEDEYVRRELAITRAQCGDAPGRLARSERYLRWRFREHQAGNVAYL